MHRMLMSGVAVAALLAFTPITDAQQAQQPTVETMPNQGGGTGPDTGGGGAAGAQIETQGGAGSANQLPEDTQSGQAQKGSDSVKKSSEIKKKDTETQKSTETEKTSDEMQKQTEETQGTDKTKKQTEAEQETTGATGATGKPGKIDIPEGKRSHVVKSFSAKKVKAIDIDIDVSVGVAVPATVVLHPVPVEIVEIVPAFRRYKYFVLASGEIVIVDPATMVVVYVLVA
jgi:archaellum component FlaD/FlaE